MLNRIIRIIGWLLWQRSKRRGRKGWVVSQPHVTRLDARRRNHGD